MLPKISKSRRRGRVSLLLCLALRSLSSSCPSVECQSDPVYPKDHSPRNSFVALAFDIPRIRSLPSGSALSAVTGRHKLLTKTSLQLGVGSFPSHTSSSSPLAPKRKNNLPTQTCARSVRSARDTCLVLRAGMKSDDTTDTDKASDSSWLYLLCLPLWLVYISNQWSRSSIYYLVDFSNDATAQGAMNVDIGFNESQYGVLASVAFTTLFAIASLGAGLASDRYNRKTLTIASAATWSLATLGTAASTSYSQVVVCRILMGLACAFSTPTAYTLIKDSVPSNRQASASSLYSTAVALASGLSSLSILIDNQVGWRNTMNLIALFGLASAGLSTVLLPNDNGKASDDKASATITSESSSSNSSIFSDVAETVKTTRAKWIYLASFLRFCSGLCIGVWGAPFFRMVFADEQSSYAVVQALISIVAATLSGILGGTIADWLSAQASKDGEGNDAVGRKLWVPIIGSILAAPTWYFAVQTGQDFSTAMTWLALEYFVAECWFGPTISTLQATVSPGRGGTAQGLFTLTGAVANFAPTILGYIYGEATGIAQSTELSNLLSFGVCFGYVSSAVAFYVASISPPVPSLGDSKTK